MAEQLLIVVILVIIWLAIVSFYLAKITKLLKYFTKDIDKGTLLSVLEKVQKKEISNKNDIKKLAYALQEIERNIKRHIQKIGYVRFNPFEELGGDHSFVLALLDSEDTGVIITGLHTRERTRVYVKDVLKGKSKYDLSVEEKKALRLAQKNF